MSIAKVTEQGFGTLRFRLVIEGCPYQFVSHPSVPDPSDLDGRTLLPGLQLDGLVLSDHVIMRDARVDARGITFRISPPFEHTSEDSLDPLLETFSLIPEEIGEVIVDMESESTELELDGGGAIDVGTILHIGTEAVRVTAWDDIGTIERHIWDTQPQKHNITHVDRTRAVRVYDHPSTLENRRAYLYWYGHEDTGDGEQIWVGQVARPPKLDTRDGVSWLVETHPVTQPLRQSLAGGIQESSIIGIYHHALCAVHFKFRYNDQTFGPFYYSNFDIDEVTLLANLNTFIADELAAATVIEPLLAEIDHITLVPDDNGLYLELFANNPLEPFFTIEFGSPLLGYAVDVAGRGDWLDVSSGNARPGSLSEGLTSGTWTLPLGPTASDDQWQHGGPAYALGDAAAGINLGVMTDNIRGISCVNPDPQAIIDWPPWRVWMDQSLEGARAVRISNFQFRWGLSLAASFFVTLVDQEVVDGTTYDFIELAPDDLVFQGLLSSDPAPELLIQRSYGEGTVADLVQEIKNESVNANDGDTPWITDAELSDWEIGGAVQELAFRRYIFTREKAVEDVLREELKFSAHMMRIESDGRIGIIPLPLPTEATVVLSTHEIDTTSITTPRSQMLPRFEPQRDGVLTTVTIQHRYDPVEDEWSDEPETFQDADVIATHKGRGQSQMEIKPFSRPASHAWNPPGKGVNTTEDIARRYLALLGRDYVVITVRVTLEHFAVLCGDVVKLTHSLIPGGDGTRGIVSRACICVGRTWELDPSAPGDVGPGTLELWSPATPIAGYAASGSVTDQTDLGGDEWQLEFDTADALNILLSGNLDGQVLDHFEVGDFIRLVDRDDATSPEVTGVITALDAEAGTATVQLDDTWTPAAATFMEFQADAGSTGTTAQRRYAYVANGDGNIPGGRGRRFS